MDKRDFAESYKKYGIGIEDICKSRIGIDGNAVNEVAVIAPLHRPEAYENVGAQVKQLSSGYYPAYEIVKGNVKFTFVTTQIGACNADEIVMALAFSRCKKLIFTGSAGAIKQGIAIGDILIPEFSLCGDGAVKYYTDGLVGDNFSFGKKFYPSRTMLKRLIKYMDAQTVVPYRIVKNFSIDTIVGQFLHIDEFASYGAEVIEMETASVFCLAEMTGLEAVAILNVSDSTAANKSLLAGRSEEELKIHSFTEERIVPALTLGFIESLEKISCK